MARQKTPTGKSESFRLTLRDGFGLAPLHAGGNACIQPEDIVAILRKSVLDYCRDNRDVIELAAAEECLIDASEGFPESIILTSNGIILSPITAQTLMKRVMARD